LRQTGWIAPNEEPIVNTLSGGVSNRIVRLERVSGEAWVIKQALGKLRVPVDWYCDVRRSHREALGLRWLEKLTPAGTITPLVFEDPDQHFIVMEAVPQPHRNWKSMLLEGKLWLEHVDKFAKLLSIIHRLGWENKDLLQRHFADQAYFESLRLEPYYKYSAQQVPAAARFIENLLEFTRDHRDTLVHGDYSPKNILVYGEHLVLLDHEVIHFGDSAFDLGFALTHLLSKANHCRQHRSAFQEAAERFWNVYHDEMDAGPWKAALEHRVIHHTLACLLARVSGRSVLEYLNESERGAQREVALSLMETPPRSITELVTLFVRMIGRNQAI
jgi:aminoglycoside phosphotransferase (APT) family kinase protein